VRLLDSSVWIEHLTGGARTEGREGIFADVEQILVSAVNLFEVGRYVERTTGEAAMLEVLANMRQCRVVEVSAAVAEEAVPLARAFGLHLADALIAATAELHSARLITLDADLLALPGAESP
jgi:predicted nucleic acid-binding protein